MYPGLRYPDKKVKIACKFFVFRNCLFDYKISFAVEKKIRASSILNGKLFVVVIRKMLTIQFSYMEIV